MKIDRIIVSCIAALAVASTPAKTYSVPSLSIVAEAASKLSAPKNIKTSIKGNDIVITWSKVQDAVGYRIYKYDDVKGKYVKFKDVTKTKFKFSDAEEFVTYKFKIAALTKSGGKLKANKNSSVIKAVNNCGYEEFAELDKPVTIDELKKIRNIKNLSYNSEYEEYEGEVLFYGHKAKITFSFDIMQEDLIDGYSISIDDIEDSEANTIKNELIKKYGKDHKGNKNKLVWNESFLGDKPRYDFEFYSSDWVKILYFTKYFVIDF